MSVPGTRLTERGRPMVRKPVRLDEGEGIVWGAAAFAASVLVGVAVERLRELLDARAVQVVRDGEHGDRVVAAAGEPIGELDLGTMPHLDDEGRLPSGHLRSVGGTLVLPAEGAVVDLVRGRTRVGSLVVIPQPDRPIQRATRMAIAATAHELAMA
jgi:hypothetical protein